VGGGVAGGYLTTESGNADSGQTVTESSRKLLIGNWGCAEAHGVVYLYYLLCRRVVLWFDPLHLGGGLVTVGGRGFWCWGIYALVCICLGDGGQGL